LQKFGKSLESTEITRFAQIAAKKSFCFQWGVGITSKFSKTFPWAFRGISTACGRKNLEMRFSGSGSFRQARRPGFDRRALKRRAISFTTNLGFQKENVAAAAAVSPNCDRLQRPAPGALLFRLCGAGA
jgi:hypothetical protein